MDAKPTRLTLHHLARHAGVSPATVSLVLRKSPLVATTTRARVQASIETLGYVYNRGAASLRSRHTHTVGAAMNELANPYFASLTAALEHALTEHGRTVFLANSQEDPARQARFIETMREYNVPTAWCCARPNAPTRPPSPPSSAPPTCLACSSRVTCPGSGLDYVGHDHRGAMRQGTAHLHRPRPYPHRHDRRQPLELDRAGTPRRLSGSPARQAGLTP